MDSFQVSLPLRPQPLPQDMPTLHLDSQAIDRARLCLDQGAVTPSLVLWRDEIVRLLNDALASEIICTMRYRRHHFTAEGLSTPRIAEKLLAHARDEARHADLLARRIVQLGGSPDFTPDTLTSRSHTQYDGATDLRAMLSASLTAERITIEVYSQLIGLIGDKDPTTRRLLEDILAQEQEHAGALKGWLS